MGKGEAMYFSVIFDWNKAVTIEKFSVLLGYPFSGRFIELVGLS